MTSYDILIVDTSRVYKNLRTITPVDTDFRTGDTGFNFSGIRNNKFKTVERNKKLCLNKLALN